NETGVFTQIYPNSSGCDSTVVLDLTINTILPAHINVDGFTLSTTVPYVTYQWFLNNSALRDATDSAYVVTENGDYTVVVTDENGCTDTSDVYTVNNVTINEIALAAGQVRVYPNPTSDLINIQSPVEVNILLTNAVGKVIRYVPGASQINLSDLAAGLYLLHITDVQGHLIKVEKVLR